MAVSVCALVSVYVPVSVCLSSCASVVCAFLNVCGGLLNLCVSSSVVMDFVWTVNFHKNDKFNNVSTLLCI